jgi:hypothetical protein
VAYINVSGTGNFATLCVSTATITSNTGTGVVTVPGLQNITLSNSNGTYRWKQLDSTSEYAIAIAATNQVSLNIVLDETTFFGSGAGVTAANQGLFKLSNDKVLLNFRLYFNGVATGDKYIDGQGYFTALAPTVSADQPVWVSPLTIEVVGDFTPGTQA